MAPEQVCAAAGAPDRAAHLRPGLACCSDAAHGRMRRPLALPQQGVLCCQGNPSYSALLLVMLGTGTPSKRSRLRPKHMWRVCSSRGLVRLVVGTAHQALLGAQMTFHFKDGALGLMSWRDSGKLVPIRDCHLQDEGANAILRLVAAALRPQASAGAAHSSPVQASTACCQQTRCSA